MKLPELNFPEYEFRIKIDGNQQQIFDEVRKKYVALTPEEWVRQHLVKFLIEEKRFPRSLMHIEAEISVYQASRRCDVLVYNRAQQPVLIAECKAPEVAITSDTFIQAATYNSVVKAPYLLITNGFDHFCCKVSADGETTFLTELPLFEEIDNE
jgi:hypothetical protein